MRVYNKVPNKLSNWFRYEAESRGGDFDYEVYVEMEDGGRRQYLIESENSSKYNLTVTPGDQGGVRVGVGKRGEETGNRLVSFWSPEVALKAAISHNQKNLSKKISRELFRIACELKSE